MSKDIRDTIISELMLIVDYSDWHQELENLMQQYKKEVKNG